MEISVNVSEIGDSLANQVKCFVNWKFLFFTYIVNVFEIEKSLTDLVNVFEIESSVADILNIFEIIKSVADLVNVLK